MKIASIEDVEKEVPTTYTKSQYRILCNLIKQKRITKQFFDFLLLQLFDLSDWKQLNYIQMYSYGKKLQFLWKKINYYDRIETRKVEFGELVISLRKKV